MLHIRQIPLLLLSLATIQQAITASKVHYVPLRQRLATTIPPAAPTPTLTHEHAATLVTSVVAAETSAEAVAAAVAQGDTFDFDVRSDQIGRMMDGLADVAARIAETRDADFHEKDDDDGPPLECHCKCSLVVNCDCWCGDKDTEGGHGNTFEYLYG